MIRILGLDVGTVRVGVALSDPLGMTAQPLEVIDRKRSKVFARIAELVRDYEVQRIVVGLPLRLNGNTGPATEAVDQFIVELVAELASSGLGELPIESWDERMSTAAAQRMMIGAGARRSTRKQNIDKIAASLILQSYLDTRGNDP